MSDADKFKEAVRVYEAGDLEKARPMLLELYERASDERMKVGAAAALLACLNQVNDHEMLLQITENGATLAKKLHMESEEAIFKSRRAVTLLQKLMALRHMMKCIKLPSTWLEFSLEREQAEYLALEERVRKIRAEADELFKEAKGLAPVDDRQAAYHLLMNEANAKDTVLGVERLMFLKVPRLFKYFRRWSFDSRRQKREFLAEVEDVKRLYMQAALLSVESGDETGPAYCHFQLALTYRSLLMFWRAGWHLGKAEKIAKKHEIQRILEGVKRVRKDFTMRQIDGKSVDYHGLDQ